MLTEARSSASPHAPAAGEEEPTDPADGPPPISRSDRAAFWTFVAAMAASLVFLIQYGRYAWFAFDEWYILAGRDGGNLADYFRPHDGHWITLPVVAFKALWAIVGLHSYRPYQMMAILTHLLVAVLLRVIMRRLGVNGWIATIAAVAFALFGAGQANVVWAFQISLEGSMALGLVHLLLSGHDGPLDRRDWLGLVAGLGALMCSGLGVIMVAIVGVAVLLRRGWRAAAFHTVPLAAIFGLWYVIEKPKAFNPYGRPPLHTVASWIIRFVSDLFVDIGHFPVLAIVLGVVLVVGLVLAFLPFSFARFRRQGAVPIALLVGALVFAGTASTERWFLGLSAASAARYVWVGAALVLPVLAVAADAIGRRWRPMYLVMGLVLVISIPWNAKEFTVMPFPWGKPYFVAEEGVLLGTPYAPFARDVPRSVRPDPNTLLGDDVTVGWLLDAKAAGKLPDIGTLSPELENQLRVRLGVSQTNEPAVGTCKPMEAPLDITPTKGQQFGLGSSVTISLMDGTTGLASVPYSILNGGRLTIELDGLHLQVAPAYRTKSYTWCS